MTEFHPLAEAKKMRSGVNVRAKVKTKPEPRTVSLKKGGTINVCDAIITDIDNSEEEMKLTLWGNDIEAVKEGDIVVITNGYTNEFRGEVSLGKGKFGQMEVNPE